ncbi:Na(+)/H(+) antiporter subunit G1 [Rubripirellula obstinata]|uniref:Na(+)/H(+) antiporter subunit G1 n=1 Tax=Rubripirellula obstinata TaxID=406547 RepID=A0A5B1CG19_9BACT|nr:monovalent cation/H(+) antiporter subunit G [Rubripirellula obstinata]KAA1259132.1 Na(+)/H(+) antiporter subunit G1 [Rubripirellula obstinata]
MFGGEIYETIVWLISGGLLISGSIFAIIGGIGICRLPEFFSRMHGAGLTDTMGAGLILAGLMVQAGLSLVTFKLVIILFFVLVTSPSSCHALARSAIAHGLKPQLDVPNSDNQNSNQTSGGE